MSKISILFRADDAGISLSANAGVERVLRAGIVRNVGWMACAPEARDAAERLRRAGGDFCIGLHATINSEWDDLRWGPVAGRKRTPSLVRQDGSFFTRTAELHEKFQIDDVETEVRAQIDLARQYGLDLSYLDTHMGFEWLPGVADLLKKIGEEENLIVNTNCALKSVPKTMRLAALANPIFPEVFSSLEPGNYIWIFHPQMEDGPCLMLAGKPAVQERKMRIAEARFLTNPRLAESLHAAGIRPISYLSLQKALVSPPVSPLVRQPAVL